MPNTDLIYGQLVRAGGKEGQIIDIADTIKVKFPDGSFGFFDTVEPVVLDTRLKAIPEEKIMMEPTASGQDPLAQPDRNTKRGPGDRNTVLGKEACKDRLFNKTN